VKLGSNVTAQFFRRFAGGEDSGYFNGESVPACREGRGFESCRPSFDGRSYHLDRWFRGFFLISSVAKEVLSSLVPRRCFDEVIPQRERYLEK
jgi:hypothetical protein